MNCQTKEWFFSWFVPLLSQCTVIKYMIQSGKSWGSAKYLLRTPESQVLGRHWFTGLLMTSNWQFLSGCFCRSFTRAVSHTTITPGAHWLCRGSAPCVDGRELGQACDVQGSIGATSSAETRHYPPDNTAFNCQCQFEVFVCLCNISVLLNAKLQTGPRRADVSVFFDKGVVCYLLFH